MLRPLRGTAAAIAAGDDDVGPINSRELLVADVPRDLSRVLEDSAPRTPNSAVASESDAAISTYLSEDYR